uniref:Uncharacterized protein n=1 Tax=Proboscia inermis TaxID=420281 RepID=A0A6T8LWA8_9STRA|mmetsp:Transcript_39937/g.40575  ORF Transcript_39937/g.40575 Transcript_39937/m.40575 type:complete len:103 (+) Transcript_39937:830-1138(+)
MTSVMESIIFGVPMGVLPLFGGQLDNGENVERLRCNLAFSRPDSDRTTLNAVLLYKAMCEIMEGLIIDLYISSPTGASSYLFENHIYNDQERSQIETLAYLN